MTRKFTWKGLTAELFLSDWEDVIGNLKKIDAVITDPPYGIDFSHAGGCVTGVASGTKFAGVEIIGDDSPFDPTPWLNHPIVVLFGANHFASRLPDSPCWLVWDKRDSTGTNDQADCELAWTNIKSPARLKRHLWNGMLKDSERGEQRLHPTQKPVCLMSWCMDQTGVKPNHTVLDPFMGSGSTGIACLRTGRNFIGIEIDQHFFSIACQRFQKEIDGRLL